MKNKLRVAIFIALAIISISCSREDLDTPVDTSQVYHYTEIEDRVTTIVNEYRVEQGRSSLQTIFYISYQSFGHNEYMIDNDTINHNYFQERVDLLVDNLHATRVGEIIACNYQSAESMVLAWRSSSAHNEILLGDYTHCGVSVSYDSLTGMSYCTNIFIKLE